jgi:hypothetical protein
VGWLLVAAGAAVLTGWSALPGRDRPWSAAAAAAALVAARVCRPAPDPERWLRGAAGEVATAHLLERLGDRRWAVLHDVRLPGSTANVDHLVIGRRGVWVLDSKAYRAPVRAGWRGVRVGGRRLDTSPVAWEASVVADRLRVEVRPLVVVHGVAEHGGRLPRRGRRCDGVRVLPAEAVVRHLRRARTGRRLGRADVADLVERAATLRPAP